MPSVTGQNVETDSGRTQTASVMVLVLGLMVIVAAAAFMVGRSTAPSLTIGGLSLEHINDLRPAIKQQQARLDESRAQLAAQQAAVARRLGDMQAQILRLNAAGQRLTEVAQLATDEFSFESAPPLGGPVEPGEALLAPSIDSLEQLETELELKRRQLDVLEQLLLISQMHSDQRPSGWPVGKGWMSSLFGRRSDPFTGRTSMHRGIDFAAMAGSDVVAVAAGVVSFAGRKNGYGQVVEINHGNGYVTRYGHNRKNLVRLGERVTKGQAIAKVGQSGRATGPHVHFEVIVDGVHIDPRQYVSQR